MPGRVRCRYCGLAIAVNSQTKRGRCPRCALPPRRAVSMEELVVRYLRETTPRTHS